MPWRSCPCRRLAERSWTGNRRSGPGRGDTKRASAGSRQTGVARTALPHHSDRRLDPAHSRAGHCSAPRPCRQVGIERAPLAQRLQQQLLVLRRDRLIELVLAHRLGEELGYAAVEVRQYVAQTLRLAAKGILGVQISVVVDLDERFETDAQAPAVIEDSAVVIGNAPGPGIEVEVLVERAGLLKAAELGITVAAAQG